MQTGTVPFRIGARGSPLSSVQAFETRSLLMQAHGLPEEAFEIVFIKTTADRVQDRALKEIGGKGLFTKEIEEALLSGRIDLAVHCVKDMAVAQPTGLVLDGFMRREDPRDAFLSEGCDSLADLPEGAIIGTSSMRRKAQVLHRRPDLSVVNFRGNVDSRLKKLADGVADATFLAMAGLNRLGMQDLGRNAISVEAMLPAVGQGALALQRRETDAVVAEMVAPLNHPETACQMLAERAFLATLEGSCETPIAGYADFHGAGLRLRGEILRPDGSEVITGQAECTLSDAALMGEYLARQLMAQVSEDFFDWRTPR